MPRLRLAVLAPAALALVLVIAAANRDGARAADALEVVVTSPADDGAGECPDATKCTLRAALELVIADTSDATYTVRFDPAAFPPDDPAVIAVSGGPLPFVFRPDVILDATGAGVVIDGSGLPEGSFDGVQLMGAGNVARALHVRGFSGACLVLGGANARAENNLAGDCNAGIDLTGADGVATGNLVGFETDGSPSPVSVGIAARNARIRVGGDPVTAPEERNTIGNAVRAISVGEPPADPFTGVIVRGNVVGTSPGGAAAPLAFGVWLGPGSSGTLVEKNTIQNTTGAGIEVASDPIPITGDRFRQNTFAITSGMAIDLAADAIRNPNDPDDADTGANALQNHPVLVRAAQAAISGTVPGCNGCTVELYLAAHSPGGTADYGSQPLPIAAATTDGTGGFAFFAPPVAPGTWVIALATDAAGNTSEFGPSARVGTGVAQCGNVQLQPGWNHAGFFFPQPLTLGSAFPPGAGNGPVSAIYRLTDGSPNYTSWFADSAAGRTLTSLNPGESYWFYAREPVALPAGFSLTVPLPVALQPGWNDFVYIGATTDIRDAFATIEGLYGEVYRYRNDGTRQEWDLYGGAGVPAWVNDFDVAESCATYSLFMESAGTLVPPQP